jgi:hypothetical protein
MIYFIIATIAIVLGLIVFIFTRLDFFRNGNDIINTNQIKIYNTPDIPQGFGYKLSWFAVKSKDKSEIAKQFKLKNINQANWESGIELSYNGFVFVSPSIGDWTFVVGESLPNGSEQGSMKKLKSLLKQLSLEFGEVQFFCTHRVVDYHFWAKANYGKIVRIYGYLGESGEIIEDYGDLTEIEKSLDLLNQDDIITQNDDLAFPDEEMVMQIAGDWSFDPRMLESLNIKPSLGIVGNFK